MQSTRWGFEALAETIATAASVVAALGLAALALAAFIQTLFWITCRFRSRRTPETFFVGRWAVQGPELFLVGQDVRRLPAPLGGNADRFRREPESAAVAFARRILAEVLGQHPPTQLALTFAHARLGVPRSDGFVLPASDVQGWLHQQHVPHAQAKLGTRVKTPRAQSERCNG